MPEAPARPETRDAIHPRFTCLRRIDGARTPRSPVRDLDAARAHLRPDRAPAADESAQRPRTGPRAQPGSVPGVQPADHVPAASAGGTGGSGLTPSRTEIWLPRVYKSGRSICVEALDSLTGAPVGILAGSVQGAPTIRINGGAPIALEQPYYSGGHTGILYFLPTGKRVGAGDTVRFTAPEGFFATELGPAPAAVDRPCLNESEADVAPLFMPGFGFSYPGSAYYSYKTSTVLRDFV